MLKHPCDDGVILSARYTTLSSPNFGRWVLAATIIGTSMVFIDGTIVNVALPVLQSEFHATLADAQWVVESYALFLAALMLMGGSLGDHLGRRRIFAIGIAIFAAASAWCGFSRDVHQLIAARAIQGIGGALLTPGSLALISASFKKEERGRAIGTWSGFSAILAGCGPVAGGWLIEHASWRWAFWMNIPLALSALTILYMRVPESRDQNVSRSLDWPGALLGTFGLGCVVYGLIESSNPYVPRGRLFGLIAAGIAALIGFMVTEAHSPAPMMPLSLFRSRTFAGANLLTLLLYSALSGALFFFPFNLIQTQGYTATAAGAALLPFILIMFFLSRWSGGLVVRYGAKLPLTIGPVISGFGFALFARPGIGGSYWTTFFPAVLVLGLGMTVSVAPLTTTVMGAVSQDRAGIASGINNAISRTAGLLSIAVLGVLLFHSFSNSLDRRLQAIDVPPQIKMDLRNQRAALTAMILPDGLDAEKRSALNNAIAESFVAGFRLVMLISAALAFASAFVAWAFIDSL
jgi:EmrB/QacA subfamily drug resistance transporter